MNILYIVGGIILTILVISLLLSIVVSKMAQK